MSLAKRHDGTSMDGAFDIRPRLSLVAWASLLTEAYPGREVRRCASKGKSAVCLPSAAVIAHRDTLI
ncbi:uncharacterized protein PADG_12457 [Paracoccidioides brasiliensis Pb18]|uniref:Uncharacterized protein n=1 Tax=Paracoccidioides brasiliensis (strain Pb18) TaxID=502780 RepID=A0A0A0HTV5_PARBD|nr:uncharacterized protein PADG_12457 [Paracoccidioides brasiliensis Pb18]KGM91436.1 hypothetical protein PADG_12457 [Paracoccidioides brasiliensis Pb18]